MKHHVLLVQGVTSPGSLLRRRTRTARLLALAACMVGCLLASVPAAAAGTGGIAGVVTGPGGAPLQGVEADVYLQPGNIIQVGWGAITDATGAYAVSNLPAGDYKVLFGYANVNSPIAPEWYDDAFDLSSADLVPVAEGAVTTGINAELAVGAKVSGRLTTPTGVGIHDGFVMAHRLPVDGLFPPFYGAGSTDADGFYVVQGLPRGTYRLQFQDAQNSEFWNDKPTLDAADDIVLTVGEARTGIDAVLGTPPPPPAPPAIVNTQLPIVGGAPIAPQVGYPLTVSRGYWTPGGAAVTVQWLVDSQPIPGATATTYTPTLADLGRTLSVRATATLAGYSPSTVTTLSTNPVSKQVQNRVRPRLKGTAKVGARLRVKPGLWRPIDAVTFRYRWYAGGDPIPGARDDRLRLTSTLKGMKIVCRVTGSAPGLDPLRVRTRASAKVTR
jgi:hypothetical protein